MKALYKANQYHFNSDYKNAIKWYLETIKVNPKECANTGAVEAKNQLSYIKSNIGFKKYKQYEDFNAQPKVNLMSQGKNIYNINCSGCHKKDGPGMPPIFPAITNN